MDRIYLIDVRMFLLCCVIASLGVPAIASGQTSNLVTTTETFSGVITELTTGRLAVRQNDGRVTRYAIQNASARAVSVAGKAYNIPADIEFSGEVPIELVERGLVVKFEAMCTVDGKYSGQVTAAKLVNQCNTISKRSKVGRASDIDGPQLQTEVMKVEFLERPADSSTPAKVEVVGRVLGFASNRLHLQVRPGNWAPKGKIKFEFAADAKLILRDSTLDRVVPGDTVRLGQALVFETGEKVIQRVRIAATGKRDSLTKSSQGKLENKFCHLSNQPSKPRELRTAHFVLQTDLSDRSANILLAKLETVFDFVSGYYRKQPQRPIECYVVRDLANWTSELNEAGAKQIREDSGLTVIQRIGEQTKAVVYACDNHSIVQHEAVHAFCAQTFGGIGPVWYAEGMAELGLYWQPAIKEIDIDPVEVSYLNNTSQQKLADIVIAGQITGDTWQAYARRWAICELLVNNPNYATRFRTLGINLMTGKADSLESAFAGQLEQMSFEYELFVKNLGNGYRVDLCSWDWTTPARKLTEADRLNFRVRAQAGWQATGLLAEPGQTYSYACSGQWKIDRQTKLNADGDKAGQGTLMGVWLSGYKLSEPFELGTRGKFVAGQNAQLFVRCRDAWTSLDNNEGSVKFSLRKSKE